MSGRRNGGNNSGGEGGTALAPAPKNRDIKAFIESRRESIAGVAPKFLEADRVIRLALVAVYKNPDLLKCEQVSILQSIVEATALGLEIGGPLAEAHLVPYWDSKKGVHVCQFQPDYKGILALARRSGAFAIIEAREVYRSDRFHLIYTPMAEFLHEPSGEDNPESITRVYAYAKLMTGEIAFEVMTRAQVERIRAQSRAANGPAWRSHWGEMAKKTVLKRFLKRQARSVEVARAIEADDREYLEAEARENGAPRLPGMSRSQQLAHRLGAAEPEFTEGTAGQITSEAEDEPGASDDRPGDE